MKVCATVKTFCFALFRTIHHILYYTLKLFMQCLVCLCPVGGSRVGALPLQFEI